jgi:hypothetical protein
MTNVIRLATDNHQAPARACITCAYGPRRIRTYAVDNKCGATGFPITIEREYDGPCGRNGLLWRPRPPRKGIVGTLRSWLFGDDKSTNVP